MSVSNPLFQPAQEPLPDNKLAVSFKVLLGLYLIIPLSIVVYIIDQYYWGNYLQSILPSRPEHFIIFQILFGTPHIIASAIMLTSNREYFQFYKVKLLVMTSLIILLFGIGSLFIPYRVLYVTAACWTVYHVFKQQHGIAKGVCRLPDWAFCWLLWMSVSAGIFIYIGVFLKNSLGVQETEWVKMIAFVLVAGLILSSILCQRHIQTTFGKCFMWSNTLLIVSSYYMYTQQYYFLAILIPRLVHDATAYVFYVTHDYNKHHLNPQNALFKYAKRCRLHVFVVLPLFSFALAFILQAYGDEWVNMITRFFFDSEIRKAVTLGIIGYLSLMHYYTEAFTWQAGSPLRKYIRFSK
ncbi:MAG: hypothetical protein HFP77_08060 [Methylococcales symbiont of Iophon sp. n. MRB-2018]|nr:MAG: hypothetical protein HFP77_08060 [Methylococcales symbiont of Iophon sp. n. MRB-2018]KAF3979174.1 MAG: hypothetical protein HFP76_08760 [Methylococcales symbiont of Iophon sp. n. MRB-2018]